MSHSSQAKSSTEKKPQEKVHHKRGRETYYSLLVSFGLVCCSILLSYSSNASLRDSSLTDFFDNLIPNRFHVFSTFKSSAQNEYSSFNVVRRAGKSFGADVYGFNPHAVLNDPAEVKRLKDTIEEHLVVVLHNVTQSLTPEEHLRLAKLLGHVDDSLSGVPNYTKSGIYNSPESVKRHQENDWNAAEEVSSAMLKAKMEAPHLPKEMTRIVKYPSGKAAFGEGAHSDLTFNPIPPSYALLASRTLPPKGLGNTHYWDMRKAFEVLPTEVRDKIIKLKANHSDNNSKERLHPVVRNDGGLGYSSLFVNMAFTRNIVWDEDVPSAERDPELLDMLFNHIKTLRDSHPEAFLDIDWTDGQMTIWDNRFTQHSAQCDYPDHFREMHRVVVYGTVPEYST